MRTFSAGMAPLTVGLLLSSGWVLTEPVRTHPGALLLVAVTVAWMLASRVSPMWPVALGAIAGALGLAG